MEVKKALGQTEAQLIQFRNFLVRMPGVNHPIVISARHEMHLSNTLSKKVVCT